jgi:hypothetical protein
MNLCHKVLNGLKICSCVSEASLQHPTACGSGPTIVLNLMILSLINMCCYPPATTSKTLMQHAYQEQLDFSHQRHLPGRRIEGIQNVIVSTDRSCEIDTGRCRLTMRNYDILNRM